MNNISLKIESRVKILWVAQLGLQFDSQYSQYILYCIVVYFKVTNTGSQSTAH